MEGRDRIEELVETEENEDTSEDISLSNGKVQLEKSRNAGNMLGISPASEELNLLDQNKFNSDADVTENSLLSYPKDKVNVESIVNCASSFVDHTNSVNELLEYSKNKDNCIACDELVELDTNESSADLATEESCDDNNSEVNAMKLRDRKNSLELSDEDFTPGCTEEVSQELSEEESVENLSEGQPSFPELQWKKDKILEIINSHTFDLHELQKLAEDEEGFLTGGVINS